MKSFLVGAGILLVFSTAHAGRPIEKILVADFNNGEVLQFTPTGDLIGVFGDADAATIIGLPSGIVVDALDRVYVLEGAGVHRYTRDGEHLGLFASYLGGNAKGIDFDSEGNLFLREGAATGSPNDVVRFDAQGNLTGTFSTMLAGNGDIAIDSNDLLYVPHNYVFDDTDDGVWRMTTNGQSLGVFGEASNAGSGLASPRSTAIDDLGNLYVTTSGVVMRYDDSGNFLGPFATGVSKNLVFDDSGNLYGTDGSEDGVVKFDSDGNFLGTIIDAGQGGLPEDFRPEAIAFLYVIPEPTTLALAALGLTGVVSWRRRR